MSRVPDLTPLDAGRLRDALKGGRFGRVVEHRESIDSTNKLGQTLAEEGAPEGTIILAEEQTHGRGRGDHSWHSTRGLGVYLSMVLRPERHLLQHPVFGLLGGLAAAYAVREATDLECALKWPNDLLIGGRKAGGILAEAFPASPPQDPVVILGVGVNVYHGAADLPENTPIPATSLALEGGVVSDRSALVIPLIRHTERLYDDFSRRGVGLLQAEILALWAERGHWVELEGGPSPPLEGRAVSLDLKDGNLILADEQGREFEVSLHGFLRMNCGSRGRKSKPFGSFGL